MGNSDGKEETARGEGREEEDPFDYIESGRRQILLRKFQYYADVIHSDLDDLPAPKKPDENNLSSNQPPTTSTTNSNPTPLEDLSPEKRMIYQLASEVAAQASLTPKASQSLESFLLEICDWLMVEANKFAIEEDPENPIISSENVLQAAQSLLSVPSFRRINDRPSSLDHSVYYRSLDSAIRTFFELLQKNEWNVIQDRSNFQIMKLESNEIGDLFLRGTLMITATPEEIRDSILDFESAPKWDKRLVEVNGVEILDERTQIIQLKFDTEKCYLKEPRDFLIVIHWFWRAHDNSLCVVATSVEHPRCPPELDMVRSKVICSGYVITPLANKAETSDEDDDEEEDEEEGEKEEKEQSKNKHNKPQEKTVCRVTQLGAINLGKTSQVMLDYIAAGEPLSLHLLRNFIHKK